MSDFEYFFSFFGLLLGLTVAEIAVRLADSIDAHKRRPIGLLTPLLAIFVLLDISSFWLFTWSARDEIIISWPVIYIALFLSMVYFLSATLIFPRSDSDWKSLDAHFWERRRYVLGGILTANIVLHILLFSRALPRIDEYWFYVHKLVYFGPVSLAFFAKSRRLVTLGLCLAIIGFVLESAGAFPISEWGTKLGLGGTAAVEPSTSGASFTR